MLPIQNRLKKQKNFDLISKHAKKFYTENFLIKYIKNDLDVSRFAFVVSTKVSKSAVKRNRLRRQMREAVRLNLDKIKTCYDVVIIAKPSPTTLELKYQQIQSQIIQSLLKIK